MTLVVDASVALKWFLDDEPQLNEASAVLDSGEALIAPDLVIAEVCNAAWRGVRVGRLSPEQARIIAKSVPSFFAALVAGSELAERTMSIASQLDHAVYDCFYLALAEARDLPLVTADVRLLGRLSGTPWEGRTQSLSDYRPSG